jgi:hypothetical protein
MALPAEGRAPHARKGGHDAKSNIATFWPRAPRLALGGHAVPRLASSPTTRTHGVRPSEKTAFGAISGLSPIRPSCLALSPWRGGLRTPAGNASAQPGACPHLATRYSFAPDDHVMPRLVSGLATRTRRPRPSEKIAFRVISDLPPVGHLAPDGPPRGGAGSARPLKHAWA